ncbi:uncharacterized protein LOC122513069 [Leptopilina heterotoma]|uniref:uncharacterized protein LOC122513069 n=1 Tax=Leptopilina heterotoma TaxID=63436 RepID=UPI001CA9D49A|nr:uncharacterized protein LOC122513069 [Leptopilina heterotoma]
MTGPSNVRQEADPSYADQEPGRLNLDQLISIEDIRPFPKAPLRKQSNRGRKRPAEDRKKSAAERREERKAEKRQKHKQSEENAPKRKRGRPKATQAPKTPKKSFANQGSEATFISENVVQLLHAKTQHVLIRVNGVDNVFIGWLISGPTKSLYPISAPRTVAHQKIEISDLQQDLQRFWEVEECFEKVSLTPEEKNGEKYFSQTHSRTSEGRYIVRQVFKDKDNQTLGSSLPKSLSMLIRSDRRLETLPSLQSDYYNFLAEYKRLGHIVEIRPDLNAPYLANRVIKQLAADEGDDFPEAKLVLENNFNVDDGLFGGNNLKKTLDLKNDLCKLLARGGFTLYKFSSNTPKLLDDQTDIEQSKNLDITETENNSSVLGLIWNSKDDEFRFTVKIQSYTVITKRLVLSIISKLFDPLGLVAPIIIVAKMLMQDLWLQKLDWDSELPQKFREKWDSYFHKLKSIDAIQIPRWTGHKEGSKIEVHGFADASSRAYAGVVYIRILNPNESPRLTILQAKTKVAPIKIITIPRLELCGIVLLKKLLKRVVDDLRLDLVQLYGWTDSTIALSWLAKHPSRWKTFVANRVQTVHTLLPSDNELWWQGPSWLREPEIFWPSSPVKEHVMSNELRKPKVYLNVTESRLDLAKELIEKYSTWPKLIKIVTLCFRFIKKLIARIKGDSSYLNSSSCDVKEMRESKQFLIRTIQNQYYCREIQDLKGGRQVKSSSTIKSLNPFLDQDGVLRVSGRLNNAPIEYDAQHPIILPKHRLSELLARQAHLRCLHHGPQLTLYVLRQNFLIIGGRNLIRKLIHGCVTCVRQKAKTSTQLMSDLPTPRVTISNPFTHCGLDYAGPISVKLGKGRGYQSQKGYIALFVCLDTRAIHLELVSDNTTQSFLGALNRFVSRRGLPNDLYSDNGKNFKGPDKELQRSFKKICRDPTLEGYLSKNEIVWHFIPPYAPLRRALGSRG